MTNRLSVTAIVLAALALAACNTVAGVGRDVQSVGETLEDAAE